jgi:hypothetical protein
MADVPPQPPEICKLCLQAKPLRHSHIIPEFAYAGMYDEDHRMIAFQPEDMDKFFFEQKGFRFHLLCDDCEALLNDRYEKPFHKFWIEGQQLLKWQSSIQKVVRGIDYATFKLFHMSILWRASVCEHPIFDRADVKPMNDLLRRTLLYGDPGPATFLPIAASALMDGRRIAAPIVSTPRRLRLAGHEVFGFVFCGCQWLYFITNEPVPDLRSRQLDESGTMVVEPMPIMDLFHQYRAGAQRAAEKRGPIDVAKMVAPYRRRKRTAKSQ